MKRIYLIIILMFCCCGLYGYYPPINNYSKLQYKGGAKNWDITQSDAGNMWFANDIGILEFDGIEWTLTPSANKTSIRSLFFDDKDDRMYFGAVNEFGYIDLESTSADSYVSLLDSLGNTVNDIWGIHRLGDDLWLRENNRVFRFGPKRLKEYSFSNKVTVSECIHGSMYIFVNTVGALSLTENDTFMVIPGTESLGSLNICGILPYGDGILFTSATKGLFYLEKGVLRNELPELSGAIAKSIAYCSATDGRFYAFGTVNDGVYILDTDDSTILHINTASGLQNNTVLSMYFDRQHNLWLGLDKGISMIELNSTEYRLLANSSTIGAGYASAIYGGRLWLGTNQGLFHAPYHNSTKSLKDRDFTGYSPLKGQVWSLLSYDNRLFCSYDKGICILNGDKADFIRMNGTWKLLPSKIHKGFILGCSYDRLFLLRKTDGKWTFYRWVEGFEESTKAFEEDYDGRIWFSHWIKGLRRLSIDYAEGVVTSNEFMSKGNGFPQDWGNTPLIFNGGIIFQTAEGFYSFDRETLRAAPIDGLNNLFSSLPTSMSIFECGNGDLFFSSSNMQALCYRVVGSKTFSSRDELLISGSTQKDFYVDSISLRTLAGRRIQGFEDIREMEDGMLMLNTEDGYSLIKCDLIKHKDLQPATSPYIREISIVRSGRDSVIYSSLHGNDGRDPHIEVSYRDNTLKFKAAQPLYGFDAGVSFSYKLKNYDKEWSQFKSGETKEYTRIPPGKYIFQVRTSVPGTIRLQSSEIPVTVSKPWFLTWWAITIYAVLTGALALFVVFQIRKIIERRASHLQEQKEKDMKEKQMQVELKAKSDELATQTMDLIRKNEMLRQINSDLQNVADYMVEDRNRSLRIISRMRTQIQENISLDNNWKKFEQNFDNVYGDFLHKLELKHPDLTISDKKLCAYIKMGLSSKEISPLLNITIRSVEMNRYRMRKKLGLGHSDNLTDYLNRL